MLCPMTSTVEWGRAEEEGSYSLAEDALGRYKAR